MFKDRLDAGLQLANLLEGYSNNKDAVVIGLPRGRVVLAAAIAKKLHLPLDVICPRKIGFPSHKEFAIGAVTETGDFIMNDSVGEELSISQSYLQSEIAAETEQARQRLALFRKGRPARDLNNKIAILVDDGLATGLTMKAAIQTARVEGASIVVVAVPVAPAETIREFERIADEVYCLSTPAYFQAVGQFYQDFAQVENEEVVQLLHNYSC